MHGARVWGAWRAGSRVAVTHNPHTTLTRPAGLCLDREVRRIRDSLAATFSEKAYNGFWFAPEMDLLMTSLRHTQKVVSGDVTVQLYKGNAVARERSSPHSLYNQHIVSMDVAGGYDPTLATGFINIQSIRLKAHNARQAKNGGSVIPGSQ